MVDFKDSFAMFLGALLAWGLARRRPGLGERYTVAVSSGVFAGESLMGVALAGMTLMHIFAS